LAWNVNDSGIAAEKLRQLRDGVAIRLRPSLKNSFAPFNGSSGIHLQNPKRGACRFEGLAKMGLLVLVD
jgi:hypothetical protein